MKQGILQKILSFGAASFLLLHLAGATSGAQVIGPEVEQWMQSAEADEEIAVILTFSEKMDLTSFPGQGQGKGQLRAQLIQVLKDQAESSHGRIRGFLMSRGLTEVVSLWAINGVGLSASSDVLQELAGQPGVESIRLDATHKAPTPSEGSASMPEWNLSAIGAPDFWLAGHTGAGVVVANLDTGVDANHQDLASRWRGGGNSWFDPNGEHATPYDKTGHGTQVMGLLVGGDAGGTAIGVAPGAQWIAVKIFNDAGDASLSAIHQGFQWVLDPDGNSGSDDGADVVNSSWGFPQFLNECYSEFEPDIEVLKAAGVAVVFSAGNRGPSGSTSEGPANNPEGFAVGAVDLFDGVANFSSRGPSACDGSIYPEVVAPGVSVRTADLTLGAFPDSYRVVSGTSAAAPHVAGAMALLISAYPNATVSDLEQALEQSAWDITAIGPDNDSGYGRIDVVAAGDWLANPPEPPGPTCTDGDGDGFFAEAGCGSELDCNDSDAGINPAACDIKRDGIDQDCDGQDRTTGKGCPSSGGDDGGGGDTGGSEGKGKTCSDGKDNDGDGLVDCSDPDCSKNKACR